MLLNVFSRLTFIIGCSPQKCLQNMHLDIQVTRGLRALAVTNIVNCSPQAIVSVIEVLNIALKPNVLNFNDRNNCLCSNPTINITYKLCLVHHHLVTFKCLTCGQGNLCNTCILKSHKGHQLAAIMHETSDYSSSIHLGSTVPIEPDQSDDDDDDVDDDDDEPIQLQGATLPTTP